MKYIFNNNIKKEEGNIKVQCKKEEFNKKNVIPKTGIFILS